MDPFEEFEFKPLTEGLGFHPKNQKPVQKAAHKASSSSSETIPAHSLANSMAKVDFIEDPPQPATAPLSHRSTSPAPTLAPTTVEKKPSQSISDLIASLPPSLDFTEPPPKTKPKAQPEPSRPQIFQPFAREDYKAASDRSSGPTIGQVLPATGVKGVSSPVLPPQSSQPLLVTNASPYRERLNESFAKAFPNIDQSARRGIEVDLEGENLVEVPASFSAGILDAMVVTGLSTILLVSILAITKVNLMALLTNAQTDVSTQIHLVLLFVAVLQMYLLTARSFFGSSLGEWAFDMQLGTAADQQKPLYPVLVAWRTILISITGFVLLPILSLIFRRDVIKDAGGLQLYRRP